MKRLAIFCWSVLFFASCAGNNLELENEVVTRLPSQEENEGSAPTDPQEPTPPAYHEEKFPTPDELTEPNNYDDSLVTETTVITPYPEISDYKIKGIQTDFFRNPPQLLSANIGKIALNFVWAFWEPRFVPPSNGQCPRGSELFENHCFGIDQRTHNELKRYWDAGVHITGVFYGTPEWARQERSKKCVPPNPSFSFFCLPDRAEDFARFVRFIANRYNGQNQNGRVVDFVIMNEVNAHDWFDYGCSTDCNIDTWTDHYAQIYNLSYDAIIAEQKYAKVLLSFEHHFGNETTRLGVPNPLIAVQPFLQKLIPKLGMRQWRIAHHPYPPDLRKPDFSPQDFPRVTFGNVGMLLGWLTQNYPQKAHARELQLTENGVSSIEPHSSPLRQKESICRSFYNVMGTPGIHSYIYHRMVDEPGELNLGLALGLWFDMNTPKPAWDLWKDVNRDDLTPPKLSCGFESLPYTKLTSSYSSTQKVHWTSSRQPPSGYDLKYTWSLWRSPQDDTHPLYECQKKHGAKTNYISKDFKCGNQVALGIVGYAHSTPKSGWVPLFRCKKSGFLSEDFFTSADPNCDGATNETLLGYGLAI